MSITDTVRNEAGEYVRQTSFVGCVLAERERNYYDDSDFYAIVWDEAKQAIRTIDYNSTRYAGGGSCRVDATPEVIEKARNYHAKIVLERLKDQAADKARRIEVGKVVRVTQDIKKGRGKNAYVVVAKGTEGLCFWQENVKSNFHYDKYGTEKAGIKTADGQTIWLEVFNNRRDAELPFPSMNLEVVNPEEYLPMWDSLLTTAERYAGDWTITYAGGSGLAVL